MISLDSLNENQKRAVTAGLGPVLVLAGAGSGKTRVLAFRIAHLIEQGLFEPGQILALTFTNKAAKEMAQRVRTLLAGKSSQKHGDGLETGNSPDLHSGLLPTMGTFHSVGARILRRDIHLLGYTSGFAIYDAEDALKLFKEVCKDLEVSSRFSPTLFRSLVSTAKNLVQTPAEFNLGLDAFMHDLASRVYIRYQNYLFQQNALDFDDLLMLPIKLFEASPNTLATYQKIFRYVLVDEYQDTNGAQYRLLKLLAPQGGLFVVGDDAQSIYGFRGSDIRNILHFEKDFPHAQVFTLDQNYRSTQHILGAAQKVIELNDEQKPKVLWTNNAAGTLVTVEEVTDEQVEAEFVAKTIIELATGTYEQQPIEHAEETVLHDQPFSILDQFLRKTTRHGTGFAHLTKLPSSHAPLGQFAVLYRTHAQSRSLEEVFMASNIPYQIVGGVKFYERKEIKDVLAYVRLVLNPRDLLALKRIINVPTRGIGEKSYAVCKEFLERIVPSEGRDLTYGELLEQLPGIHLPDKSKRSVQDFFGILAGIRATEPTFRLLDIMKAIVQKTGLESYIKDGTEMGETRWENVEELLTVASNFNHIPWEDGARQFLEEVALFTEIDTLEDTKDAVTLMTLHSAKGLEFDAVFFVGLEEGVLPHSRSLMEPKELAEEIRLAYVGMTRAKQHLFLSYARSRTLFGQVSTPTPSRILHALPEQHVRWRGVGVVRRRSSGLNDSGLQYEAMDY